MLSASQLLALKADLVANAVEFGSVPNDTDGNFLIAAMYNVPAVPEFIVWKTSVSVTELMGAGFDWTRVDNLSVGKARIWEFMTQIGVINPSQENVRAGINACFSAAGDAVNRQAIFTHASRPASRAEKLFAVGAGTSPTDMGVGPATMVVVGKVSQQDVDTARHL